MAYCTQAELLNRISTEALIQLTDDTGVAVVPVAAIVAKAIADADAEIDAYLVARYTVPFSPIPAIIQRLSIDMTIYNLFGRRELDIPETRQKTHSDGIRLLKDLARGIASMDETDTTTDSGPLSTKTASDRIMTMTTMTNY